MIKSDFGKIAVCGSKSTIIAELTILMRTLRKGGFSDADIEHCVKRSKLTNEEAIEEVLFGGSVEEKKPDKTVAVVADADTPAEDIGKKIAEIVAKTLREMKEE